MKEGRTETPDAFLVSSMGTVPEGRTENVYGLIKAGKVESAIHFALKHHGSPVSSGGAGQSKLSGLVSLPALSMVNA